MSEYLNNHMMAILNEHGGLKAYQRMIDMDTFYGSSMYDALYDHYLNSGEMPVGVAKGRTGDPEEWIINELEYDLRLP